MWSGMNDSKKQICINIMATIWFKSIDKFIVVFASRLATLKIHCRRLGILWLFLFFVCYAAIYRVCFPFPFAFCLLYFVFFAILLAIVNKLANVTVNSWAENRNETLFVAIPIFVLVHNSFACWNSFRLVQAVSHMTNRRTIFIIYSTFFCIKQGNKSRH